jgi:hypothetical protein
MAKGGGLSDPVTIGGGGCERVSHKGCGAVTGPHASLGSPLLHRDPVPLSGSVMVTPLQVGPTRIDSSPRPDNASKWICESSGRPRRRLCQPQHGRTKGRSSTELPWPQATAEEASSPSTAATPASTQSARATAEVETSLTS